MPEASSAQALSAAVRTASSRVGPAAVRQARAAAELHAHFDAPAPAFEHRPRHPAGQQQERGGGQQGEPGALHAIASVKKLPMRRNLSTRWAMSSAGLIPLSSAMDALTA